MPHPRTAPSWLIKRARVLRARQTDAEALLWRLVRGGQLGVKFRRQHPLEPYVLDFFCHELRLAVEVDGGQHTNATARARDDARSAALHAQGIQVLRFSNLEVLQETHAVAEALWLACHQHQAASRPSPPPLKPREKRETRCEG